MEITRGIIRGAKKVLVYGPEGIGKTTFAADFPDPLFIDTEGSTKEMDVARLPAPSSWSMIKEEVRYVIQHPGVCRTLVLDTADWAEKMAIQAVLDEHDKNGIEDFGYGNGYRYVFEKFGELLNLLSDVVAAGVNVVLTAHATLKKFEQPDERGAYDRYSMKLIDSPKTSISSAVKEWADMVLFANYKTILVTDSKTKTTKAQGGTRVMYTSHHPCWDAKNRYGLPEELPFSFKEIRHIIAGQAGPATEDGNAAKTQRPEKGGKAASLPAEEQPAPPKSNEAPEEKKTPSHDTDPKAGGVKDSGPGSMPEPDVRIPKALRDLMIQDHITEWDIQNFVESKGWMPFNTSICDYETASPGFISGALVAQWDKVRDIIRTANRKQEIPFT